MHYSIQSGFTVLTPEPLLLMVYLRRVEFYYLEGINNVYYDRLLDFFRPFAEKKKTFKKLCDWVFAVSDLADFSLF